MSSEDSRAMNDDVAALLEFELEALWRFGLRLTCNPDDASDLVQKTCVRALEQRHRYSPQGKFRSWLFQIQHRLWLNDLRSNKSRLYDSLSMTDETVETSTGRVFSLGIESQTDTAQTQIFLQQVCEAVELLPEAQRVVVVLVLVEELSYQEAADVLGIPLGTVMSRLARARVTIGKMQIENTNPKKTSDLKPSRSRNV